MMVEVFILRRLFENDIHFQVAIRNSDFRRMAMKEELLMLCLLIAFHVRAEDTTLTGPQSVEKGNGKDSVLKITGFGDFVATIQQQNIGNTFAIGQVEIDLESDLTDRTALTLCFAYDEGTFAIGAFTLDYAAWELKEDQSSPFAGITSFTVGGGKYDVPFGIDWHVYPSIDRKLVSVPLVVENTHNCWNDYGGYASVEARWCNATVFGANGFCYEETDHAGEVLRTENEFALGGRLGITPHEIIEIGGSYASVLGQEESLNMELVGVDLQFHLGNLSVKGEYIVHGFKNNDGEDYTNDGYYLQGLYNIGPWFVVMREGQFYPEKQERANISQFIGGIGCSLGGQVELRFEYQVNSNGIDNVASLQVVMGF
jgi:hypothetical protein